MRMGNIESSLGYSALCGVAAASLIGFNATGSALLYQRSSERSGSSAVSGEVLRHQKDFLALVDSTSSGVSLYEQRFYKKEAFIEELFHDFLSIDLSRENPDIKILDEDVKQKSFINAFKFLLKMPDNMPLPSYDIHPDGEFSFVWREDNKGIMSISFQEDSGINYAAYFEKSKSTHKGKVFLDSIPSDDLNETSIIYRLIQAFS